MERVSGGTIFISYGEVPSFGQAKPFVLHAAAVSGSRYLGQYVFYHQGSNGVTVDGDDPGHTFYGRRLLYRAFLPQGFCAA